MMTCEGEDGGKLYSPRRVGREGLAGGTVVFGVAAVNLKLCKQILTSYVRQTA